MPDVRATGGQAADRGRLLILLILLFRSAYEEEISVGGSHDLDANPWRDLYLRNSANDYFARG